MRGLILIGLVSLPCLVSTESLSCFRQDPESGGACISVSQGPPSSEPQSRREDAHDCLIGSSECMTVILSNGARIALGCIHTRTSAKKKHEGIFNRRGPSIQFPVRYPDRQVLHTEWTRHKASAPVTPKNSYLTRQSEACTPGP